MFSEKLRLLKLSSCVIGANARNQQLCVEVGRIKSSMLVAHGWICLIIWALLNVTEYKCRAKVLTNFTY